MGKLYDIYGEPIGTFAESYFKDEIDDVASSVLSAQTVPNLTFAIVTDIHYGSVDTVTFPNTISNIKALSRKIRLDGILCLGDMTDGDGTQAVTISRLNDIMPELNNIGVPVYFTAGNHDCNAYGSTANYFNTQQMFKYYYSRFNADVVYDDTSNGVNFYKDFDNLKVRLISLDATNSDSGNTPHYRYPANTVTWFANTLSSTPTGYMVVLATHLSPTASHNWNKTVPNNASGVLSAINSFISGGGTIVSFMGHSHSDYSFNDPYLEIAINCNKVNNTSADIIYDSSSDYIEGSKNWKRTYGTSTEDCFDVATIQPTENTIIMTRFGAGEDRVFIWGE